LNSVQAGAKDVFRSASSLAVGSIVVQVIALAASPILTRLYQPAEFGNFALFSALLSALLVLASLRLEFALPLAGSKEEADRLFSLAFLCVIVMTGIVSAATGFFGHLLRLPADFNVWIIAASCLLGGFYFLLEAAMLRLQALRSLALTRIALAGVTVGVQFLAYSHGAIGLIAGVLLAQGVGVLVFLGVASRTGQIQLVLDKSLIETGNKNWRFCVFSTSEGLLNVAGVHLFSAAVFYVFGPAEAGLFFLASRISFMPVSLLGLAVNQSFLSQAETASKEGRLGQVLGDLSTNIILIALPMLAAIAVLAPDIVQLVFGDQWREAGNFVSLMAPFLLFLLLSGPAGSLLALENKQWHSMLFQLFLLIARLVALAIGMFLDSLFWAILIYGMLSGVCWFALYLRVVANSYTGFLPSWRVWGTALTVTLCVCSPGLIGTFLPAGAGIAKVSLWALTVCLGLGWAVLLYKGQSLIARVIKHRIS
jgi:O-antigen/teichoic acid export membrane protein